MNIYDIYELMENKDFLYEVDLGNGFGFNLTFGTVKANNDEEAIEFAKQCYGKRAKRIRKDHWGRGPIIKIE
jgi:hypothetical protein